MRKLTTVILAFCLPLALFSQHFSQAPKDVKSIKQITEWTTFLADETDPEETIKDAVYHFRKNGQLEKWVTNNSEEETHYYHYDWKNRLIEVEIKNNELSRKMIYSYFEDRSLAEIQEKDLDLRTIQYYGENGKVAEEKTFWKGELTNNKWETMSRKVLNYNAQDSLFGEMEYSYSWNGKTTKRKTVHNFDPITQKKTETIYFNEKNKPEKTITYLYNRTGQLTNVEKKYHDKNSIEKTEYLFKKRKPWQTITTGKDYKYEKIYKEGRYIRFKEYNEKGKMLWYTDFQYEFY